MSYCFALASSVLLLSPLCAEQESPLSQSLCLYTYPSCQPFADVAKKALPAFITIEVDCIDPDAPTSYGNTFLDWFFGIPNPPPTTQYGGSGFFITPNGYIVTNEHVIEGALSISVTLHGGKTVPAKLIEANAKIDLAILKIEEEENPFPYLTFGDSDRVELGEYAVAIGSPFLRNVPSITAGIVSRKGLKEDLDFYEIEDFIQTDALINPGNSGGPLLNLQGEVIGVNTICLRPMSGYIGMGFAISSNLTQKTLKTMLKNDPEALSFLEKTIK